MKQSIVIVIVLGVAIGGIALTQVGSKTVYVAPDVPAEEKIKEVLVPEIQKREQEAIAASSTAIEQAMNEASQKAKDAMETEIKLNVNRQLQKELQEQESKLEEQVSL